MQQWRTPAKLIEEIKREDPNTCLTLYSIRHPLRAGGAKHLRLLRPVIKIAC